MFDFSQILENVAEETLVYADAVEDFDGDKSICADELLDKARRIASCMKHVPALADLVCDESLRDIIKDAALEEDTIEYSELYRKLSNAKNAIRVMADLIMVK